LQCAASLLRLQQICQAAGASYEKTVEAFTPRRPQPCSARGWVMTLTFGSLFAGIGGLDLGLERAGMHCAFQVEINDYATRILEKHWPTVARFRDVCGVGAHNLPAIDLLCGGFPCQPHSLAGERRGGADERDLWGEYRESCLTALRAAGMGLHNVLLWSKQNKTPNRWGMKSVEFICYHWKGNARVLNDCGMGQVFYDRNPIGDKRHPTEKPSSLPYKHIVNATDPGDLVLDPFGGSMSTMVAAKRAGRRGIAIELNEAMCEAGARWLETITPDGAEEQIGMFATEAA
jgi:hypothetical protein